MSERAQQLIESVVQGSTPAEALATINEDRRADRAGFIRASREELVTSADLNRDEEISRREAEAAYKPLRGRQLWSSFDEMHSELRDWLHSRKDGPRWRRVSTGEGGTEVHQASLPGGGILVQHDLYSTGTPAYVTDDKGLKALLDAFTAHTEKTWAEIEDYPGQAKEEGWDPFELI